MLPGRNCRRRTDESILDCLQRHGLVLGYRVGESQGLALQRFLAKLLVGLGILGGEASDLHFCKTIVKGRF